MLPSSTDCNKTRGFFLAIAGGSKPRGERSDSTLLFSPSRCGNTTRGFFVAVAGGSKPRGATCAPILWRAGSKSKRKSRAACLVDKQQSATGRHNIKFGKTLCFHVHVLQFGFRSFWVNPSTPTCAPVPLLPLPTGEQMSRAACVVDRQQFVVNPNPLTLTLSLLSSCCRGFNHRQQLG